MCVCGWLPGLWGFKGVSLHPVRLFRSAVSVSSIRQLETTDRSFKTAPTETNSGSEIINNIYLLSARRAVQRSLPYWDIGAERVCVCAVYRANVSSYHTKSLFITEAHFVYVSVSFFDLLLPISLTCYSQFSYHAYILDSWSNKTSNLKTSHWEIVMSIFHHWLTFYRLNDELKPDYLKISLVSCGNYNTAWQAIFFT